MQAFQVQLANRPLYAGGNNARDNADEHGVADRPTCKMQWSAVELRDAINDLRISCISAFTSRRVIPALEIASGEPSRDAFALMMRLRRTTWGAVGATRPSARSTPTSAIGTTAGSEVGSGGQQRRLTLAVVCLLSPVADIVIKKRLWFDTTTRGP